MSAEEKFNKAVSEIEVIMDEIRPTLKKQSEEIKSFGESKAETAKKIDTLNEHLDEWSAEVKSLSEKVEEMLRAQQRPGVGEGAKDLDFDIGRMLVESDSFKSMKANGSYTKGCSAPVPNFSELLHASTGGFSGGMKALTSLAASAGDAIDPRRLPGFVAAPLAPRRLRNIIPSIRTSGPVEYIKETNFYQLHVLIDGSSAAAGTTLHVANVSGFYVGQTVVVAPGTANEETHVLAAVSAPADAAEPGLDWSGTLTTTAVLANTHAVGVAVTSDTYVFTPETYLKPNAEITLDLISDSPKVLAHMLHASRQILDDVPQLRDFVNMRLLDSFVLSEERQFLYGTNTGPQIRGILNETDINTYSWSNGTTGDQKLDALRRGMTLSSLHFYPVTGIVVHPSDKEDLDLTKASNGQYIWATVPSGAGDTIWRAPVVETTAINQGTALVGAFSLGATIYDRQMANVRISEEHDDYFARNMVAIRAEERVCMAVSRPEAFVVVTFDSAPA